MKIKITPWSILGIIILSIIILVISAVIFSQLSGKWQIAIAAVIFVPLIIAAILSEISEKKEARNKQIALRQIGKQIFSNYNDEFEDFHHSYLHNKYLHNKKKFSTQAAQLLKNDEVFDVKNLQPAELLYIFASSKNLAQIIDWRGEENEGEIEKFIEQMLKQKPLWANTSELRMNESEQQNDKFIIKLFRSINKDLKAIGYKLLFFDLKWDSYVYMIIPTKVFEQSKGIESKDLRGIVKLKI